MVDRPNMARRTPGPPDKDRAMQDYLRRLRLDELDLRHIELDEPGGPSFSLSLRLLVLLLSLSLTFFLPATGVYALLPALHGLVYASGIASVALAASLWPWARAMLARPAPAPGSGFWDRLGAQLNGWAAQVPPAWRRAAMLLSFVGLTATVLLALPREAQWQGTGYGGGWFLSVGLALSAGLLGGRWLIAQAEAARARQAARGPGFVLPPWFKWVSLAGLLLGAAYASFGHLLGNGEGENFSMTGIGFAVGIGGAIWIARRFDEWEIEWRAGRRRY